jgi:TRAP-type C4-dicarboxylate transport system substrate-binding protein
MNARGVGRRSFLAATALGVVGLSGCARATAGGTVAPTRTATYIPVAYNDLYPGIAGFMKTATEQSAGQLSLDMFNAGTLLGAEQLLPGLLAGVADVMFQTSSYVSSTYPILGAMELPFVTDDFDKHRRAFTAGGPLHQLINEQLAPKGVRVLGGMPTSFEYLWTVDRPIRKPSDVRGMRIRVAGEIEGETVKALGGAPVSMGSSEIYQALERGTIDGMMSYVGTVVSRSLQKIIRYGTVAHFGAYTVDAYCRTEWYDRQSPKVREALDLGGKALYVNGTENMVNVHTQKYLPAIKAGGVQMIELSGAERAAFQEAVAPVYQRWQGFLGSAQTASKAVDLIRNA